jgi:hypothetical protein
MMHVLFDQIGASAKQRTGSPPVLRSGATFCPNILDGFQKRDGMKSPGFGDPGSGRFLGGSKKLGSRLPAVNMASNDSEGIYGGPHEFIK